MRFHNTNIFLDQPFYVAGDLVTGRLLVKTSDSNLSKEAKVFFKFYDKLDIEYLEDELVTVGVTKRAYTNFAKPFQLNIEAFMDSSHIEKVENEDDDDYKFKFDFKFKLPSRLQGTTDVPNAKCQYFIKAYLTTDENVSKHYQNEANVFDEFFKSLNHTYCKQEVVIHNKTYDLAELNDSKHVFEAKSSNLNVHVTLPKAAFAKGESIPLHIEIKKNENSNKSKVELHKLSFKLFQVSKVHALVPREKAKLFDKLLAHSSRKRLTENFPGKIVVEEFIEIPNDVQNSTTRNQDDNVIDYGESLIKTMPKNQIRVNYKISLEFWRNFLVEEIDLNIPILVNPEI